MKKLNLEKLELASEEVLQRNQMTTIYGGSCASFDCYCTGNSVTWQADYCSAQAIVDGINDECGSSGGRCTPT